MDKLMPPLDKAGVDYWDHVWRDGSAPDPFHPLSGSVRHHADASFHRLFEGAFAGLPPASRVLEVGCARSRLLPYFASHYGFAVTGIDYSEIGCRQARAMLDAACTAGTIIEGDLFDPPAEMVGQFDAVYSIGVVEHFQDVSGCILSMRRFLKESGRMLTCIPNLVGLCGMLEAKLDRGVFDVHTPLDRESLMRQHRKAGMQVERCEYFMFTNWSVLNFANPGTPVAGLLSRITRAWWLAEPVLPFRRPNRFTSPYIVCLSNKTDVDSSPELQTETQEL